MPNRFASVSVFVCLILSLAVLAGCRKPDVRPLEPPAPRTDERVPDEPAAPAPTASITASPPSIDRGEQTTLSWETQHASSILIDQGVGNVNDRGSIVVSPTDSTTYTLVARGSGGEARASTRVTIVEPTVVEPVVSLSDQEGLRREIEAGNIQDVFFDYDRAELSATARAALQRNAVVLKRYPEATVVIEGHCDERGTEEYNLALGDRRALATRDFLLTLGVSQNQMRTISYGEERPFDQGHNEAAWAKNRRAHFVAR